MRVVWIPIVAAFAAVGSSAPRPDCLLPPARAPIVVAFAAPPCPYCSGQRGVEYSIGQGVAVRSAGTGVVTFSGVVVGTRYVVVKIGEVGPAEDLFVTYGMLDDTALRAGDTVKSAQVIGHASRRLYFGVRRAGTYIDPVPLLAIERFRYRLVPADGSRPRVPRTLPPSCEIVAGTASASR